MLRERLQRQSALPARIAGTPCPSLPHRRNLIIMPSEPQPAPHRPDADQPDPVTPEVEEILRDRLKTFDEDAKASRPWEDVLADLKARRPLPPSPR
jgi:hypothetical protein